MSVERQQQLPRTGEQRSGGRHSDQHQHAARIQQELLARYKPLAPEVESTEVDASDGSAMTRGMHPRPGRAAEHRGPLLAASPMHSIRRVSLLSYGGFEFQKSQGAPAWRAVST